MIKELFMFFVTILTVCLVAVIIVSVFGMWAILLTSVPSGVSGAAVYNFFDKHI